LIPRHLVQRISMGGDAMLLCAPDTRSGMCRNLYAFLTCTSHLPRSSNWSLTRLLFPPLACISLIVITCFNWPINRICVNGVCAEHGGCWIHLPFYDSQVTLVTRLRDGRSGVRILAGIRPLSSSKYPHRLLGSPSLIFSGCHFHPGLQR
jgi:hypothetical protein